MIAYLSGGMENAIDEGADWRRMMRSWLKENLNHDVFDPVIESQRIIMKNDVKDFRTLKKSDPEKFREIFRKLIHQDLKTIIENADYLIVLWDHSVINGGGTHGEVTMAYWENKPIFLVNKLPDLSAWISSCSSRTYDSFGSLKKDLLRMYN